MAKTRGSRRPEDERPGDIELARSAALGDRKARHALAERLYDRVRATVRYLSGGHRDQEDWVQLVVMEILRSAGSYRGQGSLEGWANRIAVRKTMRLIGQRRRRDRVVSLDLEERPQGATRGDEEKRHLVRRHLARVLGSMSPKYRTVIVLRVLHGYSPDEIAEIIEVPRNTVRQRLRRGRRILKGKLIKDPIFEDWILSRES